MTALPLTSLGTILMVLLTFYFSIRVGRMRGKVLAPATSGDPEFEKAFRIHYNTIEQLIMFLPMLWLSVGYYGDTVGGALALVWLIGRLIYMSTYQKDPTKRTPGVLLTLAPLAVATVGAIIPLVQALL